MDTDDEVVEIIIDSGDEEWAASFAPKPKLDNFTASRAAEGIGVGATNANRGADPEKDEDDEDDDIEIVEEKMVVRRTPAAATEHPPVVAIQLTAEEQQKILRQASKNFMRDIRPKGKITGCSIVVGNKKAAEAEARLRMEEREKEKDAGSAKRKFGTELAPSKKRKQEKKESKDSTSDVANTCRSSSDQENTTPLQDDERQHGHQSAARAEAAAATDCHSFNGSFVNYIRTFTAGRGQRKRAPVAKKTASVIEPAWGSALSGMKAQYTEFLAEEFGVKHLNGTCYVSAGIFSKVYSNFSLEVQVLRKRLNEDIRSGSAAEDHFIYSGWRISHVSLRAASAIVDTMGRRPAVLHECLGDLTSASRRPVVLINDLSGSATRAPKPSPVPGVPGTHLSDLSEEEFGDLFGLCTHEKAEKMLEAKRRSSTAQAPSSRRKKPLRRNLQEGPGPAHVAVAAAAAKRDPKVVELGQMCTGRVKPLFRTTRGLHGGDTAVVAERAAAAARLEPKDMAKVDSEVSRATLEQQQQQPPPPVRTYDAPPFDPVSGKIVSNPPDVVRLCRTPLLDKKGIRFPDGWFIRGKLKPDKTRYHFYYHSPDGKRFKNYQEAVNYCLENGHAMSDLDSSPRTGPKKRKSSSKQGRSQGSSKRGPRTPASDGKKKQCHKTAVPASNAICSQAKVVPEPAPKSQKGERNTPECALNNTAENKFKYLAVRKFPMSVSRPTSHSSPSPSTSATDDDYSPTPTVNGKSMISKKRKRSPNAHPDLNDGPPVPTAAADRAAATAAIPVNFNLSTFRPLPFRSVDGWFSTKVSALRRIVLEAEKEAGGGKRAASAAMPTSPAVAANTSSPTAPESADPSPLSKPELERRAANGSKAPSVAYSEGLVTMTDLNEWKQLRARAMQYTNAAERKASGAVTARMRKQELVSKKIAECSAAKRRFARDGGGEDTAADELCLPPGCYRRRTSSTIQVPPKADSGVAMMEGSTLYCTANGKTFDSLTKLWAAETADVED